MLTAEHHLLAFDANNTVDDKALIIRLVYIEYTQESHSTIA